MEGGSDQTMLERHRFRTNRSWNQREEEEESSCLASFSLLLKKQCDRQTSKEAEEHRILFFMSKNKGEKREGVVQKQNKKRVERC
jgi:hypothetical protein